MKNLRILQTSELQRRLRAFKEQRGAEFALTALGYFGSYARNEARPESDVDVVFETGCPNLFSSVGMHKALEASLGRRVDLVRLHECLRPEFKARIEREAVYV